MTLMTADQQREVRKRIVATAVVELEGGPAAFRRQDRLKVIEFHAKEFIRDFPGATIDDARAIFTDDLGAGPIGDEIRVALERLELGAGPIEHQDLSALAKGTRPSDQR